MHHNDSYLIATSQKRAGPATNVMFAELYTLFYAFSTAAQRQLHREIDTEIKLWRQKFSYRRKHVPVPIFKAICQRVLRNAWRDSKSFERLAAEKMEGIGGKGSVVSCTTTSTAERKMSAISCIGKRHELGIERTITKHPGDSVNWNKYHAAMAKISEDRKIVKAPVSTSDGTCTPILNMWARFIKTNSCCSQHSGRTRITP